MRRYVETARRYRWVIVFVLALTWGSGAALAYNEYTTSFEADATIWTQRQAQQLTAVSPQDPSLATFVTPAAEQAGILVQLLQTRSFLADIVQRTSLQVPSSTNDERKFFDEFSKRFRVEVLGGNLFRLSYRARDPRTGPEVVMAALALRQQHLAESRAAVTDAATSYYRSELTLAQTKVAEAQKGLDLFDQTHRPPLSQSDDYQQRQLRVVLEDAKSHVGDLTARIDQSAVMPGVQQMADSLDFQVVDKPLAEATPSGGTRAAAVIGGSAFLGGLTLAMILILGGTLLAGRAAAEPDITHLGPATLFATIPEVPRGRSWTTGRELRTALAAVAFPPAPADPGEEES
jgi:uncharacterized protein involved in exopolysaccharide biosynthesis